MFYYKHMELFAATIYIVVLFAYHHKMETENEDDALQGIMDYCDKHPTSKITTLVWEVQNSGDERSILNLLEEISEKPEICVDFNISLQHFLNKFLRIATELQLSEAGFILLHAAKIYSRRVDYIQEAVERHMTNICSCDAEFQKAKEQTSPEKTKRKAKSMLTPDIGAFDIELVEKELQIIPEDKRAKVQPESNLPPKRYFSDWVRFRKWETSRKIKCRYKENHLHPAMWNLTTIRDFEDEDEVDSIRNYRLFTYRIEHRFNTLVPDINFPMYFKVKDFLHEDDCNDIEVAAMDCEKPLIKQKWPPLSEEYINKYIGVENEILRREMNLSNQNSDGQIQLSKRFRGQNGHINDTLEANNFSAMSTTHNDESAICLSSADTPNNSTCNFGSSPNSSNITANEQTVLSETNGMEIEDTHSELLSEDNNERDLNQLIQKGQPEPIDVPMNNEQDNSNIISEDNFDLGNVQVLLPHFRGRSVLYKDLHEIDFRMLNPIVQVTKMFSSMMTNILDIKITLDSQLKHFLGVDEGFWNSEEPVLLDKTTQRPTQSIILNIFGLPQKRLKQKNIFKLPDSEFLLFKNDRIKNFTNQHHNNGLTETSTKTNPSKCLFTEINRNTHSPDFLGFSEADIFLNPSPNSFRKISMDSGICDNELMQNIRLGANSTLTGSDEENNNSSILKNSTGLGNYLINSTPSGSVAVNENSNISPDLNNTILNLEQNTSTLDRNLLSSTVLEDSGINTLVHDNSSLNAGSLNQNNSTKDIHNENETRNSDINNLSQDSGFQSNVANDQSQTTFDNVNKIDIISQKKQDPSYNLDIRQQEEVENWSIFLAPILVKTSDHFDVYDMGTDIINKFSTKEDNPNPISFADVMKDKNPIHTGRYFLSTLLLANQDNLKINVENYDCNQPCKLSDLKLELKSRTRYTVALEDDIGKSVPKRKIEKSNLSVIESVAVSNPPKLKKVARHEDTDSGFISYNVSVLSNDEPQSETD